jgi:6-pyruvoyl-tetrahydropterin synthase
MQVHLRIEGLVIDNNGMAGSVDFSSLKHMFRKYLDNEYDHQLHLNERDEWAAVLYKSDNTAAKRLPGLVLHMGDPTVENLAREICEYMAARVYDIVQTWFNMTVEIEETKTNGASWTKAVGSNSEGI